MPPGGSTFDENSVLAWTRGDFRGVWEGETIQTPALRAAVGLARSVADEHGTLTHLRRGRWPRHPLLD